VKKTLIGLILAAVVASLLFGLEGRAETDGSPKVTSGNEGKAKEREKDDSTVAIARAAPLLNLRTEVDIKVRDFGHDLAAIKAAFALAAKTSRPCRVVFEKRTYVLKGHAERHALRLDGLKNVVVEGGGARFEVEDPQKLFMRIGGAENVILRNFSVDYTRPPFTQGWIRKVDRRAATIEVELADGFPDLDEKVFREAETKAMFVKDRANPLEYKKSSEYRLYVNGWTRLGNRRFTMAIYNPGCLKYVEAGDPFVQTARTDGGQINMGNCRQLTLHNITIHAASAAGISGGGNGEVNLIGVRIVPPPGAWQATGADGIFFAGGRAGPWIENCELNAIADDNLVIKGGRGMCINVVDARTFDLIRPNHRFSGSLSLQHYRKKPEHRRFPVQVGDTLVVVDPKRKQVIARPTAVKVVASSHGTRVTLDQELPWIAAGTNSSTDCSFFNEAESLPGFVVRNNVFKNGVRFGLLLKSHHGVIEGNHFENYCSHAIAMMNTWQEFGPIAHHVTIRDNTFIGGGDWPLRGTECTLVRRIADKPLFGTIAAAFTIPEDRWTVLETDRHEPHAIVIEGNTFRNWYQSPAINLANTYDYTILDNTFELSEAFKKTMLSKEHKVRLVNCGDGVHDSQEGIME